MRILYQSLSYVPSRRASSVHVMRMCAAFARAGHDVVLTTKASANRLEPGIDDDYAYYGVDPNFEIVKLPRPGVRGGGLVFAYFMRRLLKKRLAAIDLVYSRETGGALAAARLGLSVVLELHGLPPARAGSAFDRIVNMQQLRRIVVISEALRGLLKADGRIDHRLEILLAPDAADPLPESPVSSTEAPDNRPCYGYVGSLYKGKAMEILVPLARRMPASEFHVVGGSRADLERWRRSGLPQNLLLHGFVPPSELSGWYSRFDVLLLPSQAEVYGASGQTSIGDVMSPMKLFEYMAAGKPIVASDLPVLREVLRHEGNALLASPQDIDAWEAALQTLEARPTLGVRLAEEAREDLLRQYTWDARAQRVLRGLQNSPSI